MTIKSLSYIHNLLVNEEQKASLKLKWIREEWVQATDDFESGAISEENYRSLKGWKQKLSKPIYQCFVLRQNLFRIHVRGILLP